MPAPRALSVIVPVRNGSATLARTLSAILNSELRRDSYELIVVDDASEDGSPEFAARYADTVVRLSGRSCGSAYARNRGAELAQGEILAFVDADAMVRPNTLAEMLRILSDHPALDAVAASHDPTAGANNLVSQYWNLMLHFGEISHAGTSANVASPCAAIRRSVFIAAGMFDEWRFGSASLEGLELGGRLEDSGREVLSPRHLEAVGLKRWNVRLLCGEVWNRSVLLSRSLGYQRTRIAVPSEVVFTLSRPLRPVFAVGCVLAFSAAFFPQPAVAIKLGMILLGGIVVNFPEFLFFVRARGIPFAIAVTPLHSLIQAVNAIGLVAGWVLRGAVGDREPDAATQAYAEVGVETWPPVPRASGR